MTQPGPVQNVANALSTATKRREDQSQGVLEPVTRSIQPTLAPDSGYCMRSVLSCALRCRTRLISHGSLPQALRVETSKCHGWLLNRVGAELSAIPTRIRLRRCPQENRRCADRHRRQGHPWPVGGRSGCIRPDSEGQREHSTGRFNRCRNGYDELLGVRRPRVRRTA
jgi:hypothetical protein